MVLNAAPNEWLASGGFWTSPTHSLVLYSKYERKKQRPQVDTFPEMGYSSRAISELIWIIQLKKS